MHQLRLLIVGAPGCGKGTISKRIVEQFGFTHVSSGDKLREHVDNKTEYGQKIVPYVKQGLLVPNELILSMMISEIKSTVASKLLLDGFPRTESQAQVLRSNNINFDAVLNIIVPHDVIIKRLKHRWIHLTSGRVYNKDFNVPEVEGKDDVTGECLVQRDDDKPEIVAKRLNDYDNSIRGMVEFYKKRQLVRDFSGETTNVIWPQVEEYLRTIKIN